MTFAFKGTFSNNYIFTGIFIVKWCIYNVWNIFCKSFFSMFGIFACFTFETINFEY